MTTLVTGGAILRDLCEKMGISKECKVVSMTVDIQFDDIPVVIVKMYATKEELAPVILNKFVLIEDKPIETEKDVG